MGMFIVENFKGHCRLALVVQQLMGCCLVNVCYWHQLAELFGLQKELLHRGSPQMNNHRPWAVNHCPGLGSSAECNTTGILH